MMKKSSKIEAQIEALRAELAGVKRAERAARMQRIQVAAARAGLDCVDLPPSVLAAEFCRMVAQVRHGGGGPDAEDSGHGPA